MHAWKGIRERLAMVLSMSKIKAVKNATTKESKRIRKTMTCDEMKREIVEREKSVHV